VSFSGESDRYFSLPKLDIVTPDQKTEAALSSLEPSESWFDDRGELCMWSTTRLGRPCLVAPGLALYELFDDAVTAIPFQPDIERLVEDTYWRSVLPLFLQHGGAQALHASAIVGPKGVVAICGLAGAGKSTLAYGLSRRGYRLWADDAVVVTAVDPPGTVSLQGKLKLLADIRRHFDLPAEGIAIDAEAGEEAPLSQIFVLRAEERDTTFEPSVEVLEASAAFTALVENAYVYGFEGGKRTMSEFFLELAASVPVREFIRPKGIDRLDQTVDSLEDLITSGGG
jgi:hypothetical protein